MGGGGGGVETIVSSEKRTQFPDRIHEKHTTSIQTDQNLRLVYYHGLKPYLFVSCFLDSAGCSLPSQQFLSNQYACGADNLKYLS